LLFGVATDLFTFRSIQISYTFLILSFHVIFSGAMIAFLNLYDAGAIRKGNRVLDFARLAAPLAIQFSFGGLASASFIFYFFSGSFFVSWPFILLIAILMVANEVFREYYLRASVQIAVYYFLLFSIFAVVLPYLLQELAPWVFIASGIASLIFIFGYIALLSRVIKKTGFGIRHFVKQIAGIFVVINIFYFLNIIPPIPLSLRDSVVGHGIERTGGNYTILIEGESFWEKILSKWTVRKMPGGEVVVYVAIFAPGKLETDIVHDWQHKENGKWVSKDRFSYNIIGGRLDGYRGYSKKTSVPAGEWRVDVETARGQVLGRVRVDVVDVPEPPPLLEIIK
jgi:hypothetical protein